MNIIKQCIPKLIHEEVVKYLDNCSTRYSTSCIHAVVERVGLSSTLIHNGTHDNSYDRSSTRNITIRFVTTRNITNEPGNWFGTKHDKSTDFHYGEISLPILNKSELTHQEGPVMNKMFSLRTVAEQGTLKMLTDSDYKTGIDNLKGDTLVYIHGYKTSFMSAVRNVAQWASYSNFSGQIYLFSWPSQARLTEYTADRKSAATSSTTLVRLLTDLCANKTGQVHLFAHSMGSLALVKALQRLEYKLDALFENVILAAPDLDADSFVNKLWPDIKQLAKQWSVYFSSRDLALIASRYINSRPRLGANAYPIKGLEFIDASSVQLEQSGWLGSHSYYKQGSKITRDILELIKGVKPRHRALIPHENNSTDVWRFADSVSI